METLTPYKEIIELIRERGGEAFTRCFQCGLCDVVCPWNEVKAFSMRRLVREATFGFTDIERDEMWRCTTCGRCPQHCPRDVGQIESGLALRRIATEYGVFPSSVQPVRTACGSLVADGNPLGEERDQRAGWADALSVPLFQEGMSYLYFPGCYLCYDPRLKRAARSTATLLARAALDFGILGPKESCCGESVRKTGDEELFKRLARQNIKAFVDHGVRRLVVSSPHCYHTFKHEYPDFGLTLDVLHVSQLLLDLLRKGDLELTSEYPRKVVYHDPCYLGRHNDIFTEPRDALRMIPGLTLLEMPHSHTDSLCCGGGGGRIWMETPAGERFSDLHLQQAVALGAEVLATSCPYCISNFEDSKLNLDLPDDFVIKDVSEIICEAL